MLVKVTRKIIWLIIILIVMTTVSTPLYFYFLEFGPLSKYSWQNNQSWANFGSFIGGTIGPILSGIACIAVYLTYKAQQQQISLFKLQTKIDELQRLIATTTDKIDSILYTTPYVYTQSAESLKIDNEDFIRLKNTIFRDLIQALGTRELEHNKNDGFNKFINATTFMLKFSINHLNIELNHLGKLLSTYHDIGGSREILTFYMEKYESTIGFLYCTHQLHAPSLEKHYDLNAVVQRLQSRVNDTCYN
ncbi:hypothetical protein [Aeromonas caviae]|uniref:hypothetical protein n=1 Tax=Aeromonas caviae TaxID=648 RepID=UPI003EC64B48